MSIRLSSGDAKPAIAYVSLGLRKEVRAGDGVK